MESIIYMDSEVTRNVKKELRKFQELPGLVVKLQAEGLVNQLEKACGYAYDTADVSDETYKNNFKLILNQIIDVVWEDSTK